MNSITKILVPFDFTSVSKNALNYALQLLDGEPMAELTLTNATSSANFSKMKIQMDKLVEKTNRTAGHILKGEVVVGELVEAILESQAKHNPDIIIMGTAGRQNISDNAVSNTSLLAMKSTCPLMVIPAECKNLEISNITLAIDKMTIDKPDSLTSLLVIARKYNAKIHVLTIYEDGDADYLIENKNESVLDYYFELFYSFSSSILSSKIADSILEYDKKRSIDMLAIIPRNQSTTDDHSGGRLTQFLTLNTDIPLLIMR